MFAESEKRGAQAVRVTGSGMRSIAVANANGIEIRHLRGGRFLPVSKEQ
jgi:hypothetical protein